MQSPRSTTRVLFFTGKGGVGKTTTAAATAALSSSQGVRTLVLSADPAHSLGDVLGIRLGPTPRSVSRSKLDPRERPRCTPSRSIPAPRWSGTGATSATT